MEQVQSLITSRASGALARSVGRAGVQTSEGGEQCTTHSGLLQWRVSHAGMLICWRAPLMGRSPLDVPIGAFGGTQRCSALLRVRTSGTISIAVFDRHPWYLWFQRPGHFMVAEQQWSDASSMPWDDLSAAQVCPARFRMGGGSDTFEYMGAHAAARGIPKSYVHT